MPREQLFDLCVVFALLVPACSALGAACLLWFDDQPRESTVLLAVLPGLTVAFLGSIGALALALRGVHLPREIFLGEWFATHDYAFESRLFVDETSLLLLALTTSIVLVTARFGARYLHREPGFTRFYALLALGGAALGLVFLAGSLDLLIAGWEVVGLTSVLLIAFFHDRRGPSRGALRAFIIYRSCDAGLLFAAAMLHGLAGSADWTLLADPTALSHGTSITLGFALLFAALGKSALFPVSGWLPRAMEGPTPSSAAYYGALSIHCGVYLLLRAAPLIDREPLIAGAVVTVGVVTTLHATVAARVHADVKGALAYATLTQVGLMLVWVGIGWTRLALVHLLAHAALRTAQLLRSPSVIRDSQRLFSQLGRVETERALAARWLPLPMVRTLHAIGLERFHFDALIEGLFAGPVGALGRALDRFERSITARVVGEAVTTDKLAEPSAPPDPAEVGR